MANGKGGIPIVCRYLVKPGQAEAFEDVLGRHWGVLYAEGLATAEPARLFRADDKEGNVAYFEHFSWLDETSSSAAHESVAVMKLWEPMGALCEDMEFWQVRPFVPASS